MLNRLVVFISTFFTMNVLAFDHHHQALTQVLSEVVVASADHKQTRVDYAKLHSQPQRLNHYLQQLSAVNQQQYQAWSPEQQLSFLINAYNGFTLQLIVQNYPEFAAGEAESIKDLGSFFSSAWKQRFFTLLGEKRHLDNLEHDMIRVWFKQPLIHAALVCAAVSCPPLRAEAFVAEKLTQQLDSQMALFLSDEQRNKLQVSKNQVQLSSIFKWYAEDFEQGYLGFTSLNDLISRYQAQMTNSVNQRQFLQQQKYQISFLDYDWRLNDIATF